MTNHQRSFALHVDAQHDGAYSLDLTVTTDGVTKPVTRIRHQQVERLRQSLIAAVTASKHARTALSHTRQKPIALSEDAGVRLTLQALATARITKPLRVEAIRLGVDAMTSEEALYWYANVTGTHSGRALRALRTLLADD